MNLSLRYKEKLVRLRAFLGMASYKDWTHHYSTKSLTPSHKKLSVKLLEQAISVGDVDRDMVPYLRKINTFPTILTLFSCTGHPDRTLYGSGYLAVQFISEDLQSNAHRYMMQSLGIDEINNYQAITINAPKPEQYVIESDWRPNCTTFRWRHRDDMDLLLNHLLYFLKNS